MRLCHNACSRVTAYRGRPCAAYATNPSPNDVLGIQGDARGMTCVCELSFVDALTLFSSWAVGVGRCAAAQETG